MVNIVHKCNAEVNVCYSTQEQYTPMKDNFDLAGNVDARRGLVHLPYSKKIRRLSPGSS